MTFLLLGAFALAIRFFPRTAATLLVLLLLCAGCVEADRGVTANAVTTFAYAALLTAVVVILELQARRLNRPTPPR